MKQFVLCFIYLVVFSCQKQYYVNKIEGERLEINRDIESDSTVDAFIAPYRKHLNASLDSIISFAPATYSKKDGDLNTAIGNLMADAVYQECNPIFKKRYNKTIDFVLLNHGGIRAVIPEGPVTLRTAYEVMPFENAVVVVGLKADAILKMVEYLSEVKRAHPLSKQINITFNSNYELEQLTIKGAPLDMNKTYYVATNDYLYNGGDKMVFFKPNEGVFDVDYKIRNVLIDYFKKTDTLRPKIDDRFIRKGLK
jgi:5'-nucleotidase